MPPTFGGQEVARRTLRVDGVEVPVDRETTRRLGDSTRNPRSWSLFACLHGVPRPRAIGRWRVWLQSMAVWYRCPSSCGEARNHLAGLNAKRQHW